MIGRMIKIINKLRTQSKKVKHHAHLYFTPIRSRRRLQGNVLKNIGCRIKCLFSVRKGSFFINYFYQSTNQGGAP